MEFPQHDSACLESVSTLVILAAWGLPSQAPPPASHIRIPPLVPPSAPAQFLELHRTVDCELGGLEGPAFLYNHHPGLRPHLARVRISG